MDDIQLDKPIPQRVVVTDVDISLGSMIILTGKFWIAQIAVGVLAGTIVATVVAMGWAFLFLVVGASWVMG